MTDKSHEDDAAGDLEGYYNGLLAEGWAEMTTGGDNFAGITMYE